MKAALTRAAGLLAVTAGVGLLPWLSGKDPALTVLRARSAEQEPTAEALDSIRDDLGLGGGPLALLGDWAGGLVRGDLGTSWVSGAEVLPSVLSGLGVSLLLMGASLVVAVLVAVALCARTVVRGARGTLRGHAAGAPGAMLASVPEFLLATVGLIVLGVWCGWLPTSGWAGPAHLVLPALAMGVPAGGLVGRLVDDALPAAFGERWAVLWRASGVTPWRIAGAATRRAMPALVPQFGLVAVGLTGGAVAVETVFAVPGIGRTALGAAKSQDLPLLQGAVLALLALGLVAGAVAHVVRRRLLGPALRNVSAARSGPTGPKGAARLAVFAVRRRLFGPRPGPRPRSGLAVAVPAGASVSSPVPPLPEVLHRRTGPLSRPGTEEPGEPARPARETPSHGQARPTPGASGQEQTRPAIEDRGPGRSLMHGAGRRPARGRTAGASGASLALPAPLPAPAGPLRRAVPVVLGGVLLGVVAWGLLRDPYAVDTAARLAAPSGAHPLGTDGLGRDVLARLGHGAASTVGVALAVCAVSYAVALVLGFLPDFTAGVSDVANALPPVVVGILVAAVLGPGTAGASLAVALVSWPPLAAHAAALVQEVRASGFLTAQRAIGSTPYRILTRHVLPAVAGPVARHAVLRLPAIALALASLGFLGLGVQPPAPEWGLLLDESRMYVERAPWAALAPATALALLAGLAVSLSSLTSPKARRP
ncbi:ABC transporter permease subunit [Streptomyces sp. Wb2n-11]|uniref:ABC transporter permease subunit n=1 Tax=Streptomyces sp. Wb2n-11 TaxID=1030533 RepID=UPI000AAE475F|nr:ABC transporter permease subunit [Streptomyces sp. Wb2n-11]